MKGLLKPSRSLFGGLKRNLTRKRSKPKMEKMMAQIMMIRTTLRFRLGRPKTRPFSLEDDVC